MSDKLCEACGHVMEETARAYVCMHCGATIYKDKSEIKDTNATHVTHYNYIEELEDFYDSTSSGLYAESPFKIKNISSKSKGQLIGLVVFLMGIIFFYAFIHRGLNWRSQNSYESLSDDKQISVIEEETQRQIESVSYIKLNADLGCSPLFEICESEYPNENIIKQDMLDSFRTLSFSYEDGDIVLIEYSMENGEKKSFTPRYKKQSIYSLGYLTNLRELEFDVKTSDYYDEQSLGYDFDKNIHISNVMREDTEEVAIPEDEEIFFESSALGKLTGLERLCINFDKDVSINYVFLENLTELKEFYINGEDQSDKLETYVVKTGEDDD